MMCKFCGAIHQTAPEAFRCASSARIIEIIDVLVGTPWSQERRDALAFFRAKYNHRENEE